MSKTLVIILSETRASELTFNNFKQNVLDELSADLCVCIGVKPNYDYENPFYQTAKYRFLYEEPDDFGSAFEEAYQEFLSTNPGLYEKIPDANALYGKIATVDTINPNIVSYGSLQEQDIVPLLTGENDAIVHHTSEFEDKEWKNKTFGIKCSDNIVPQKNVVTYCKRLHWRNLLKIKNQFLGGIKDETNEHPGSAGILIFFRWFLLKKLKEYQLLDKYERFIITRSDYMYQLPHPKVEKMNSSYIWIPDEEHYSGYTDRHVILSPTNIESYLNILTNFFKYTNRYMMLMKSDMEWNLEKVILFNLGQNNVTSLVREFPYVMYTVRNINGLTRWEKGIYNEDFGYYIKYIREYYKSCNYKNQFIDSGKSLDEFYNHLYIDNIAFGTGYLNYDETYKNVLYALKNGYRIIDTAESYHNEEAVGKAIIDSGIPRHQITIISKYLGGQNYGNPGDVLLHLNESLRRLNTSYIDIYLLHLNYPCIFNGEWVPIYDNPDKNYKCRIGAWLQMIELKKNKYVNKIGVSNWNIHNLEELKINNLLLPDVIENEWLPEFNDKELYTYCIHHNIQIYNYGLFSRSNTNYHNIHEHKHRLLLGWCIHKKMIPIIRSNNFEHIIFNLKNSYNNIIELSMIQKLDSLPCMDKGHCLTKLHHIQPLTIWKPFIVKDKSFNPSLCNSLLNGEISCIIKHNVLSTNQCDEILKSINHYFINNIPHNTDIPFRNNEIGITIDNDIWRDRPDLYWEACKKTNMFFESLFFNNLNPLDIFIEEITNLLGPIKRMSSHDISCPKGVFRVLTHHINEGFPYHTDGFNYGEYINSITNINRKLYPEVMNCNTNSIFAAILILNTNKESKNEIDLYNSLVDDLDGHDVGMYSHWFGTKYNCDKLYKVLKSKPYFSPILNKGDLYIFSASRIHRLNNFIKNQQENRVILGTFLCVNNEDIILYQ